MSEPEIITEFKGELNQSEGARFGIVVSRFNRSITKNLLNGCIEALSEHNVKYIEVAWCPGAFELPLVTEQMINTNRYDAVIALGAVVRGETYHFEAISDACITGLQKVTLKTGIPVALGVITPENLAQAKARSEPGPKHKGREAGLAALEMVNLLRKLPQTSSE
ncbi:MAG: 6,7-dimethyl-8-ribityllumazine synthase [Bacteroidetes bacterium]|nr:6,7-dimethyl-8-ribityllumazine synthase [Bacteroidota bacterium]